MPPTARNRYKALQDQRAALLAEARTILDNPEATPEQSARADAILADASGELAQVDAALGVFEALFEAERRAPAVSSGPATVTPRIEQDPMRGFRSIAEFAQAVHLAGRPSGQIDQRLIHLRQEALAETQASPMAAPSDFHHEGHSADGYMVPPAARDSIWQLALADDDLFGLTNPEPTESNAVAILRDESTPWGATGIQARWGAEASQMTPSRLATEPSQIRLHKLYAFVTATEELLEDAPLLSSRLTTGAARAISWKLAEAFVRGTGTGQPLGYEHAACTIAVAKESSQSAASIIAKNLVNMYSRRLVLPGSRWAWLANPDCVPQFVDLKIGNEPSWQAQNQGLAQAPSGMLLGIPLKLTEHAKTMGAQGDIALVDFAGYFSAVKSGGAKFASSIHLLFDYNLAAFRWTVRAAGQPYLSTAVAAANGSSTKSSFIVLAVRP